MPHRDHNPTRRKNLRLAIACARQGTRYNAPLGSLRFYSWLAGNRHRAKNPVKAAADLDRPAKRPASTRARQWRPAGATRTPNPPLPAQQARYRKQTVFENALRNLRRG